jgi:hypothetical protein
MLDCLNFVRIMFVRPLDLDITVLSIFRLPTSPQHNSSTLTFMKLTPGGSLGAQLHLRHMYSTSHVRYVSNNIGPVGSKRVARRSSLGQPQDSTPLPHRCCSADPHLNGWSIWVLITPNSATSLFLQVISRRFLLRLTRQQSCLTK